MIDQSKPPLDELAHFGVKGMKWGQRKSRPDGISAKTNRTAQKDATEFTKAKLFYGEGAGTRRKLIKAKVEERSKDPAYKAAFDHHVSGTDLSKRANQAQRTRKRKDATQAVKKTGKGVHHILNGNSQFANVTATVGVAGVVYAKKTGADKKIAEFGRKLMRDIRSDKSYAKDIQDIVDRLK